jgi:hypothetical protein
MYGGWRVQWFTTGSSDSRTTASTTIPPWARTRAAPSGREIGVSYEALTSTPTLQVPWPSPHPTRSAPARSAYGANDIEVFIGTALDVDFYATTRCVIAARWKHARAAAERSA